jgi:hypothetical protein
MLFSEVTDMEKEVISFVGFFGIIDLFLLYSKLTNIVIVFVDLVKSRCVLNELPKVKQVGIMRRPQFFITIKL